MLLAGIALLILALGAALLLICTGGFGAEDEHQESDGCRRGHAAT